ncbi:MAG: mannose-6-phosphate isomerase, class I [Candidatus Tyloplasma litorale]|nr:MAG: mannose-6-phosphate isomerase, class I [Mycoplasmatales bacterium]
MFKIEPKFSEKIWGGSKLKQFGFDIPSDKTGEAWIISAYKDNSSILDNGIELREFYQKNKKLFNNYPSEEFPLLAKILDANDNLSIQVHPNDENAQKLENYPFGKTECWYVLDAQKDTKIIIGTNAKNKKQALEMIQNKDWNNFLKTTSIKKDDLFDIKAGTVHAILKDTVVYELQQSSDITYRLYDFDRVDDNGNKRELHIEKSLDVIDYNLNPKKIKRTLIEESENFERYSLIKNEIFTLEKWIINNKKTLSFEKNKKNFLLITVIKGNVIINNKKLESYESGIITSNELKKINLIGDCELLVGNPKQR